MPELPEVETIRRDLAKALTGLQIQKVRVYDCRVVRMAPRTFVRELTGRRICSVARRGKALLIGLDRRWLVVQPMMTGQMILVPPAQALSVGKATRVIFELSKGWRVLYNDQRLFGRLQVVEKPDDLLHLKTMGPEPLEDHFSVRIFSDALKNRRVAIKALLLDHRLVAGIGNIYAAEGLFLAGIDPQRKAASLKPFEIARLHQAIRKVLRLAIRMRGTSLRNYRDGKNQEGRYRQIIKVYGRDGEPCRRCGAAIQRIVQQQRSTFYCPQCQR